MFYIHDVVTSIHGKILVAAASLISLAAVKYLVFDVRCALDAAKMLYVVKRSPTYCYAAGLPSTEIVWVLADGLAAASPAQRLRPFPCMVTLLTPSFVSQICSTEPTSPCTAVPLTYSTFSS